MKYIPLVVLILVIGIFACETKYSYYSPHDPNPDNILTESAIERVIFSDSVSVDKGAKFKVRLADGYPCFSFQEFETEKAGMEYFITAKVLQTEKLCDSTAVKIERPWDFEPDEPGTYLLHFYQNNTSYYNIQVTVVE